MNTQGHLEKHAEVDIVTEFVNTRIGLALRVPIMWDALAEQLRHEFMARGWFDLADDVHAEHDGVSLRWTRLEARLGHDGMITFVLDQTLSQKAGKVS